ncbi:hypothetical protein [Mesorhizobium sp. SP-1A]|uniref:hypothetical protein n=1 Tax=Mesorhizobium sp. SP-1A TaxID=3077840 RepID=UPI0028F74FA1|nr:hypothetical protein [Mesorhizobium sp. SP-1A]
MNVSVPASEIIREAEKQLIDAHKMRISAYNLLREAASVEEQARTITIEAMGHENGLIAFEMAKWSMSGVEGYAVNIDLPATKPAEVRPVSEQKNSAPTAAITEIGVTRTGTSHKTAPEIKTPLRTESTHKEQYFGENVPPARIAEADEIVAQASSYVAQGRKGNPYGSDRGKNAWRKALFTAAFNHIATKSGVTVVSEDEADLTQPGPSVEAMEVKADDVNVSTSREQAEVANVSVAVADLTAGHQAEIEELTAEEASAATASPADEDLASYEEILSADDYEYGPSIGDDVLDDDHRFGEDTHEVENVFDSEAEEDVENGYFEEVFLTEDQPDEVTEDDTLSIVEDELVADVSVAEEIVKAVSDENVEKTQASAPIVDPFDDVGELPPANPAPPPRGFSSAPTIKPVEASKTASGQASPKPSAPSMGGFAKPTLGGTRPSAEPKPVDGPKAPEAAKPTVSKPSGFSSPTMPTAHTPRPIPPHRRPGNGQVLQQPMTLPSAIANVKPAIGGDKPKPNSFSSPPSFMNRKA